ncbi:hypothetical protein HY641_01060 [Candidatus Woesearchaeota archaeon]|nr:hypothetical protein [Candidatus Woesearchaeota archaeon]
MNSFYDGGFKGGLPNLLFEIHQDQPQIAKAEIEALTGKEATCWGSYIVVDARFHPRLVRLAFTRRIFKIVASCDASNLLSTIDSLPKSIISGSFAIRVYPQHLRDLERPIAKILFHKQSNPKVDLTNPDTLFAVFIHNKKVIVARHVLTVVNDFEKRKAHKRPGLRPVSLHPKLAAAMVNLTGIRSGRILDPCVGTGGILLEASLMGLMSVGIDLDQEMVRRCRATLDHYGEHAADLRCQDALLHKGRFPYVVSDLPYARNTPKMDVRAFYKALIGRLEHWKTKQAVLGMPHTIDPLDLIKGSGFKVRRRFTIYVHKSLSKQIVVLERKNV